MTLVPVPTKTARSHNDIKGRRPFDVPAVFNPFVFSIVMARGQAENPNHNDFMSTRLPQSGIHYTCI